MEDKDIRDQLIRDTSPDDAFRFFAASEFMNLPAIYASGHPGSGRKTLTVVARNVEREFPMDRIDEAFALYRTALEELGYLE